MRLRSLALIAAAVTGAAAVAFAAAPPPPAPPRASEKPAPPALSPNNLVPNGAFEKGEKGILARWQRPDDLTSFWVDDPLRKGTCLKIDSDVYKEEYRARQDEMKKDPVPPARPKTPTTGSKYDTVAGVEGVSFYSDWIPVTPGQHYRLSVDARVDSETKTPKVFVKGYFVDKRRPAPYERRVKYKKSLDAKAGEKWQTFSMTFCPTVPFADIQWVRVMFFAYWPPGVYYFDNVSLVPVDPPEEANRQPEEKKEGAPPP
jgi:hypothetical protein